MKIIDITRSQAKNNNMPSRHVFGIISENCMGYWGTGASMLDATIDARKNCPETDLGGCWAERVA